MLKLAKFITKTAITLTPDFSGFLDCFQEESKQVADTMETFETDFSHLVEALGISHIVVFIDDLDRCSSDKVIETFETIKLFLCIPACTFVIGADAAKIQNAVADIYKVGDSVRVPYAKDYLEKIIQIPFTIPEQTIRDIVCYVGMLIVAKSLKPESWPAFCEARSEFAQGGKESSNALQGWARENASLFAGGAIPVIQELAGIMPYVSILGQGLRGNPRQIKRFLNILSIRRRLAEANGLEVDQGLLIKFAILEYVWSDFFDALAETVDPETGRSELLGAVTLDGGEAKKASEQSQLVSDAIQQPGLTDFIRSDPPLSGETELTPYLFLAQTSLSPRGRAGLIPADESARLFAERIASGDSMRSRTGAKQAAAQDPSVAGSVVRALSNMLPSTPDDNVRTNIVTGLQIVCRSHPQYYGVGVTAIGQLDPGRSEPVAIAVGAFLSDAEAAGTSVDPALAERFGEVSSLVAALKPKRKGP